MLKFSLCLIISALRHEDLCGSGSIPPPFLTRWKWVVGFKSRPLYSQVKSRRYPLDRRLGGSQSWPGRYGEEQNLVPAGNMTPVVQPVARRYTDWAVPTPSEACTVFIFRLGRVSQTTSKKNLTLKIEVDVLPKRRRTNRLLRVTFQNTVLFTVKLLSCALCMVPICFYKSHY
jgi:hypothetical protein